MKTLLKESYMAYARNMHYRIESYPNECWCFMGSMKGVSRIPGCMVYNNRDVKDPQDIVDSFAQFLGSVYAPSCGWYLHK